MFGLTKVEHKTLTLSPKPNPLKKSPITIALLSEFDEVLDTSNFDKILI
jgi:hypothetical protein